MQRGDNACRVPREEDSVMDDDSMKFHYTAFLKNMNIVALKSGWVTAPFRYCHLGTVCQSTPPHFISHSMFRRNLIIAQWSLGVIALLWFNIFFDFAGIPISVPWDRKWNIMRSNPIWDFHGFLSLYNRNGTIRLINTPLRFCITLVRQKLL